MMLRESEADALFNVKNAYKRHTWVSLMYFSAHFVTQASSFVSIDFDRKLCGDVI